MTYTRHKLDKNLLRGINKNVTTYNSTIPYFGTAIDMHTEPSTDRPLHPLLGRLNDNLEMAQIHMKEISDELYKSREHIQYLEDLLKKFNLLTNKTDTTDVVDDTS